MIGHIDRAWAYSIQAPKPPDRRSSRFNSLGFISRRRAGRVCVVRPVLLALCGALGGAVERDLADRAAGDAAADRDLVTAWIQRNDAQNYVLLGDPACEIRADVLA